jgi:hypothetical protein
MERNNMFLNYAVEESNGDETFFNTLEEAKQYIIDFEMDNKRVLEYEYDGEWNFNDYIEI